MPDQSISIADRTRINVETQTVDAFVSANMLKRIDFIKMDIEGSQPSGPCKEPSNLFERIGQS
jgi:hypothetical protein